MPQTWLTIQSICSVVELLLVTDTGGEHQEQISLYLEPWLICRRLELTHCNAGRWQCQSLETFSFVKNESCYCFCSALAATFHHSCSLCCSDINSIPWPSHTPYKEWLHLFSLGVATQIAPEGTPGPSASCLDHSLHSRRGLDFLFSQARRI